MFYDNRIRWFQSTHPTPGQVCVEEPTMFMLKCTAKGGHCVVNQVEITQKRIIL